MKPPIGKAIDPKRVGISKSAIVATNLCNRKGWFGERIRDADGRRLSVPMPERVLFGVALDEAIQHVMWNAREGHGAGPAILVEAIEEGLGSMASRPGAEDLDAFAIQEELARAVLLFQQNVLPELVTEKEALWLQGMDGESLRSGDGQYIGTPDITVLGDKPAILDVKSSTRSKSARDLYSAEMAHYAALYHELWGALPAIGYLTWVRTVKTEPRWQVLIGQATTEHLVLASSYREATKAALAADSPAQVGFNTALCGSCEWKIARPELGFSGCAIGQSVDRLGNEQEEV